MDIPPMPSRFHSLNRLQVHWCTSCTRWVAYEEDSEHTWQVVATDDDDPAMPTHVYLPVECHHDFTPALYKIEGEGPQVVDLTHPALPISA